MSASAAKNLPSPEDPLPSSPQSRALHSHLQSFNETVSKMGELSRVWKATCAGEDSSGWRRRWKAAQVSLETLEELSEPSPNLAVSG